MRKFDTKLWVANRHQTVGLVETGSSDSGETRWHVTQVAVFGTALAKPLNRRRRVTVELPDFVVRAIKYRVEEANEGDTTGELVSFNDVVEWLLVTEVSLRRMPHLEQTSPDSPLRCLCG
jgi:hypothetical protein